jgi:hypothetical protein
LNVKTAGREETGDDANVNQVAHIDCLSVTLAGVCS